MADYGKGAAVSSKGMAPSMDLYKKDRYDDMPKFSAVKVTTDGIGDASKKEVVKQAPNKATSQKDYAKNHPARKKPIKSFEQLRALGKTKFTEA